jgi:hypothetical protein
MSALRRRSGAPNHGFFVLVAVVLSLASVHARACSCMLVHGALLQVSRSANCMRTASAPGSTDTAQKPDAPWPPTKATEDRETEQLLSARAESSRCCAMTSTARTGFEIRCPQCASKHLHRKHVDGRLPRYTPHINGFGSLYAYVHASCSSRPEHGGAALLSRPQSEAEAAATASVAPWLEGDCPAAADEYGVVVSHTDAGTSACPSQQAFVEGAPVLCSARSG